MGARMTLRDRLARHRLPGRPDAAIVSAPEQPSPRQNEGVALPDGAIRLIDRFVAGQTWLWVVREALDAQSDAGVGSQIERRYVVGLLQLVDLERLLRFVYEYAGCARGELGPCDRLAVVRCEACAVATAVATDGGS